MTAAQSTLIKVKNCVSFFGQYIKFTISVKIRCNMEEKFVELDFLHLYKMKYL